MRVRVDQARHHDLAGRVDRLAPAELAPDVIGGVDGDDVGPVDRHGAVRESPGCRASTVTTMPLVMTSDTCRCCPGARQRPSATTTERDRRASSSCAHSHPHRRTFARDDRTFRTRYLPVPLHLVNHPLVHDALMELRDVRTSRPRSAAPRIASACCWRPKRCGMSRRAGHRRHAARAGGRPCRPDDVVVVPVLRAGLGMLDAVLELLPSARVGHIGLQRDEATAIASKYYTKLPRDLADSFVLMIDPMLATGGSAVAAIDLLKAAGARTHPHDLHRRRARRRRARRAASSRRRRSTRPSSTAS